VVFKGLPSRIGHWLDISLRTSSPYFTSSPTSVLTKVKLRKAARDHQDEAKYRELDQAHRPSGFKAMMGAEAIKELTQAR